MKSPPRSLFVAAALFLFLAGFPFFLHVRREASIERLATDLERAFATNQLDSSVISPILRTLVDKAPHSLESIAETTPRLVVDPERPAAFWCYSDESESGGRRLQKSHIYSITKEGLENPSSGHSGFPHSLRIASLSLDGALLRLRIETSDEARLLRLIHETLEPERSYDAIIDLDAHAGMPVGYRKIERYEETDL